MPYNRRNFLKNTTALTAALPLSTIALSNNFTDLATQPKPAVWPVIEGPDTPKIILNSSANAPVANMRLVKQFGVDYILMGGPQLPWTEEKLRETLDRFKAEGLSVINMMLPSISDIIYGRPGRDEQIKKVQDSLIAAGKAGLPIVEYNFYAHRLTEGYYNVAGRGGSQYLAYDYDRKMENPAENNWTYPNTRSAEEIGLAPKELQAKANVGAYTKEQLWDNITVFLKAVIPVAEKAGVRMALHPNDPPAPLSRGSQQIMNSFENWKRLLSIVDSPSNGMTYDCGVSNEVGADPLEVLKYLADRDRINHVHFRNCLVEKAATRYIEVFPDQGTVNMFGVMRELVKRKYRYGLFAEHPRGNDLDKKVGSDFAGYLFNLAHARGIMQSVLTLQKEGKL
ncbi:MAG: mannonate dehydratase [Chitinophagaceae bacterium]